MIRNTKTIGKWATWILACLFVSSLLIWIVKRERLPRTVRIATAEQGGLYFKLGSALELSLSKRINRRAVAERTLGSAQNCEMLMSGEVDLAIVQGGPASIANLSIITPLYPELILVIVRKESGIERIADLADRDVALGQSGSGNRQSALKLLEHYGVDASKLGHNQLYFKRLLDEPSLDAAIVTAGVGHPDVREVLQTNDFRLLPIDNAEALDMLHPFVRYAEIPQGLFSENPSVPSRPIATLATTAILVTRPDAPDELVSAALAAVHEENLRLEIPTLISRQEAPKWAPTRLHPVAQRYFHPSDSLGLLSNVMESLAATKELLFALGAGIYLIWLRWRRLKEKEAQELISCQKEYLDVLLEETLRIEEAQMETIDASRLGELLDNVTKLKLRALHEFTEEELRGDQAFTIFLTQCANLIHKIQLKIISLKSSPRQAESDVNTVRPE